MRLIVAGSRDFLGGARWARAFKMLDDIRAKYPQLEVISGMAPGADAMGAWWARNRKVVLHEMPAQWKRSDGNRDPAAGVKRNLEMAARGTHLLAFWDGESPGTKHMISAAERAGLRVHVVRYTEWQQ
jgi:hypothetical protein